ncbi:MAG: glucokinase [Desulfatiglandaceae bacterium]
MEIKPDELVIAGDIGGTKTTLGIFSAGEKKPIEHLTRTYESGSVPSLEKLLEDFVTVRPGPLRAACFGVAGPVVNGRCKTTNLPWEVSESGISRLFGWRRVKLVNDLAATATALPLLSSKELHVLNKARSAAGAPVAVVAPGTGLGMAFLIPHGKEMLPVSSEGGHMDFPPILDGHCSLWRELKNRFGHVSIERVVSGPGLLDLYRWLRRESGIAEPEWLSTELSTGDPAEVVSTTGLERRDSVCTEAMRHFVRILGSVCGNAALMLVARGGLYLGGGIPPKILPLLDDGGFIEAFCDKGRFSGLMRDIPVRVIMNPRAALLGAARVALDMR